QLPLRSVGSKGTPIGTTTHHRHSTHAHTPRRDSLSSSAQLTVTVVQVAALPFRKVVESSMLPQHGLRCKFHLSVGGKALGVVGATASTAGQANALVWQEGGGCSSMQLNVALSRDLWLGIDVLCGSLIIAQRQRYRAYVEAHLVAVLKKHKLCVFAVGKGDDILSAAIPGHDILLVGGTDLVILDDLVTKNPSDLHFLPRVKLAIQVKREVDINSTYEAMSQLIALDALAPDYVMVLLTDLTTTWEFLWISDIHPPCIHKMYVATPGDAFQVIRAIVDDDETELELACMERPLKRRKLDEACEDAGDGIRERVQQYYDIQSMLGPDDDMAEALARDIVRCIPQYRAHIEFK
ncbi:hypothetical protein DYB35_009857, partial [Aphanomyces astaci]